ncbi:MAG: O-antigen polysaccharide polymerase Wzy [Bacteroides sp.]|nr:O-antigen polysaccharide polymerase Wzy [Bacteroides sp.]
MKNDLDNNKLNLYFQFIISFITVCILYSLAISFNGKYDSEIVYITNSIIIIYSLIHIISNESKSYSAIKIFYLFIFFFMGFAPLMQYKLGTETVGGYKISESTYILTNIILIFVLIIFDLSYKYIIQSNKRNKIKKSIKYFDIGNELLIENAKWRNILLCLAIFSTFFTIYTFRNTPWLLLIRGIEDLTGAPQTVSESGNFSGPLFDCIIRPISVLCCINYLALGKNRKYKFIFIIIALIGCFPTSLSRLRTAAYYMPILILLLPKLRYNNRFILFFIAGFLIVFPLLNNFRTWSTGKLSTPKFDFEMFCNMNYDSYQSLAFVIQNDIVTYGKQLSVALFFWIPRSIWPDKPYMSGRMVAHEYNLWFDQISMNYFGEGYLNAGIIGIFIFTIILANITARFDYSFWIKNKGNLHSFFAPFYLLFIGMYFFFMRGDLMYGLEYTLCLMIVNYFIYFISKRIILKKSNL